MQSERRASVTASSSLSLGFRVAAVTALYRASLLVVKAVFRVARVLNVGEADLIFIVPEHQHEAFSMQKFIPGQGKVMDEAAGQLLQQRVRQFVLELPRQPLRPAAMMRGFARPCCVVRLAF